MNRCLFIGSILALTLPLRAAEHIPVQALGAMVAYVSDVDRSVKWYQDLFGLAVVERGKNAAMLQIGGKSRFIHLVKAADRKPGIDTIGFLGAEFEAKRAEKVVRRLGASSVNEVQYAVLFEDPAGIKVSVGLHNEFDAKPINGLLPLRDFNHFTIFVPDALRNVQFYQQLFGLRIDTYQGPMPIIRVGEGNQFLAFVGGRENAFVHHACFSIENFDPDKVLKKLSQYGLKPRAKKRGPAGPLEYYVVMRMPNRGGAKDGTPELYLTDPDGILLQLQDVKYAGGGGYLGDKRGMSKK